MIKWLLEMLRDEAPRPFDLTGATDGHFLLWEGTTAVTPDFSLLKRKD